MSDYLTNEQRERVIQDKIEDTEEELRFLDYEIIAEEIQRDIAHLRAKRLRNPRSGKGMDQRIDILSEADRKYHDKIKERENIMGYIGYLRSQKKAGLILRG